MNTHTKTLIPKFLKYCEDSDVDYDTLNSEQIEVYLLEFAKREYGDENVEVLFDEENNMMLRITKT